MALSTVEASNLRPVLVTYFFVSILSLSAFLTHLGMSGNSFTNLVNVLDFLTYYYFL